MKIAFLSRYQNSVNRGAETFVFELSKRLSRKFKIDIFSGKEANCVNKIIKGNYDIVIPMNGRMQSLKASVGRLTGGYRVLITGQSGIGRDDIWNIAIAKPDIFVALTDHSYRWAKKWAWGSKIVKIPNGVDVEKFKAGGEKMEIGLQKPIVLSVGALVGYKHHEKLISAMSKVNKGSLLIVGLGKNKDELEKMGRKLLGDRFKIMHFDYEDMPEVYGSCDLFSLPSWDREAFGIVYLEALSSGLGVVAPDDETRREIVGEGGLFTEVDDPVAYAECIGKALEIDWSEKARNQAMKFSWEKIALEYEKVMLE
ncbi:hypothetical protein A3J19_05455 [Candidatus Daviesbacteria bacterium RIFCSPLOWO2_02_FULL_41_8]|uniref:Glycosyl transferase family 1 domain-containing protein n=3 Tax=Candidatus Daviesiibacteriota TaxID=1752718 RepID=A0A1F5NIB2_9BACT|nr:MAG: hypothetical protein A2871_03650 [Candidatus Daviesbacteria bacterium RIFCSPHIGHO2_01_FULL_41_23]OGE32493.1 MAG: hypothetical protein A3D83_02495 [Candidatus Daviesbacteria bacterium RIFCSPHIGHO2_02_FULL_41_10]OGE62014.1 MAG: hypothetical protein A2967_03465 [Candidatus Daviesbacteria bacterium RIFCSPLOWO2_01_FULL_41_32]OGE77358.1 MAG: hypothetical protein A3J19_05455 [Candidatus Daviesbacteria bacterium RIFCSPLOWO2_02_FULL_41_8]